MFGAAAAAIGKTCGLDYIDICHSSAEGRITPEVSKIAKRHGWEIGGPRLTWGV